MPQLGPEDLLNAKNCLTKKTERLSLLWANFSSSASVKEATLICLNVHLVELKGLSCSDKALHFFQPSLTQPYAGNQC